MKCEACGGRGFTELEHGLIMVGCEPCDGTGEVEDVLTEETLQMARDMLPPQPMTKDDLEALSHDSYIPHEAVGSMVLPKGLEEALNDDTSIGGIGQANQPAGSPDTSKPKQPKKPKAKRQAKKRTRKILPKAG